MSSITIEDVDEDLRRRLQRRAANHGRSVEVEARDILVRLSLTKKRGCAG